MPTPNRHFFQKKGNDIKPRSTQSPKGAIIFCNRKKGINYLRKREKDNFSPLEIINKILKRNLLPLSG
jgi:hypothetical protein